ncbi:unnamed protein product [Toxocara canis]|uniref:Major sperm protein n=1 Tax=Toxocara canis TaxID=6265 RepID=A0A183UA58_TOXCA|nr:unnamed protein product [Toxocara canis]
MVKIPGADIGMNIRSFNSKLVMTLERPVDKQAVHVVKFALWVEKTPHSNPSTSPRQPVNNTRVSINSTSLFTTIMADPYNPLLMEAVPPKRMDTFYAQIKASSPTPSNGTNASSRSPSLSNTISSKSPTTLKKTPASSRKSLRQLPYTRPHSDASSHH